MAADSDMHAIVKATIASGVIIKRFSNDCRKDNSIVITLTNQTGKHCDEPISRRSKRFRSVSEQRKTEEWDSQF